ncbi:MAG: hypothetical protein SFU91_04705 [Chloroherpetonaceae bacterium]|nr:hypothetical protein [Chloroherpetonaceae bacterium]
MKLTYKNYTGIASLDSEEGFYHGEVIGIKDVITFQGETVLEAMKSFQESIED